MPDSSLCLRLAASLSLVFEWHPHILNTKFTLEVKLLQPKQVIWPIPKSRDREVLCGTAQLTGKGPGYRSQLPSLQWRGRIVR